MTKEIKLRTLISRNCYIPEKSEDGVKWERWTRKMIEEEGNLFNSFVKSWQGLNYFSDSREVYFRTEMECSAFLGAAKVFYRKQYVEFENVNV